MSRIIIKNNLGTELNKALRDINHYGASAQTGLRKAIRTGTERVFRNAVNGANVGPTGNLRRGIKMHYDSAKNYGEVKSTAPHGHLYEYGTVPRIVLPLRAKALLLPDGRFVRGVIQAGRMPARPFMGPAIIRERPKIQSDCREAITHVGNS